MLRHLQNEITTLDREITVRAKSDDVARRLMTILGIGPLIATAIEALAPPSEIFSSGRDFAAWIGLCQFNEPAARNALAEPRAWVSARSDACSSFAASAVVRWAKRKGVPPGSWLARMLASKPPMLVIVALANKNARVAWALITKGGIYRAPAVAA
jgi:transposase